MLEEARNGADAHEVVEHPVLLVRAVDVVRIQTETEKHGLQPQLLFEQGHDGDASTAPGGDRLLAEGLFHRFARREVGRAVEAAQGLGFG